MSEYLDSTGLGIYDAQIKSYIKSVSGNSTGVRIITLNSAPTSSTLTYTLDGVTYNFKPGDEVRVVDNNSDTGYKFYKLHNLSTEGNVTTATWKEANAGGTVIPPTYDGTNRVIEIPSEQASYDGEDRIITFNI